MTIYTEYQPVDFSKLPLTQQRLKGQEFSSVIVIDVLGFVKTNTQTVFYWKCLCKACGKYCTKSAYDLKRGTSCGCIRKTKPSNSKNYRNPLMVDGKRTLTSSSYYAAIERCSYPKNKKYHRYGGRGITFHKEWRDNYDAFVDHVGLRPSKKHELDRIDNNGNYEPGNVRWITHKEQMNNREMTVRYEFDGMWKTKTEWCAHFRVPKWRLAPHFLKKWTIYDVLKRIKGKAEKRDALAALAKSGHQSSLGL